MSFPTLSKRYKKVTRGCHTQISRETVILLISNIVNIRKCSKLSKFELNVDLVHFISFGRASLLRPGLKTSNQNNVVVSILLFRVVFRSSSIPCQAWESFRFAINSFPSVGIFSQRKMRPCLPSKSFYHSLPAKTYINSDWLFLCMHGVKF